MGMNIGILLIHNPTRPSPLLPIAGRTIVGHALDVGRSALGEVQATVVTEGLGDEEVARWCRWSGLGYRSTEGSAVDGILAEVINREWTHVVLLSAHSIFVPRDALVALNALLLCTDKGIVSVVPTEGRYPLGAAAIGLTVGELDSLAGRGLCTSELAAISNRSECARIVLPDHYVGNALPLDLCDRSSIEVANGIVSRLGQMPAHASIDAVLHAASPPRTSPWQGASGPLLIAEIGGNHEGNFEVACTMTELAIHSGADCVKFQLYRGESLVSPVESPDRHRHFQRFELSPEQHIHLAKMCREAGVGYAASVWDAEMLEWIDPYMDFYKIGSGDLTAWPMIDLLAHRGKPILLSSGLATLDEIVQTVGHIRRTNSTYLEPSKLCVMQCTSMYPIPDADAHLLVMNQFRDALDVSVGYSDHTVGTRALLAAAAMGAEVLEFHFTDSREGKSFRDHKVSLEASEVRHLRDEISQMTELRGKPIKLPQASELAENHEVTFRRGVYARRNLAAGTIITAEDLVCLRPAHGTDARDFDRVVGAQSSVPIQAYAAIHEGKDYSPH